MLEREDGHHVRHVLRMEKGDTLQVSDGSEYLYRVKIVGYPKNDVLCSILEQTSLPPMPGPRITLLQSIPKGKRMEWLVQKSTEVGVCEIIPIIMHRSIRVLNTGREDHWIQRWQRIAEEAAKQCGRFEVPRVQGPFTLSDALKRVEEFPLRIYFDPNDKGRSLRQIHQECPEADRIALVIGPEGGVSDEDASLLSRQGFVSALLGDLVLRVETAGILSVALVRYEWCQDDTSERIPTK
jgi:16S rRNA (uracil1498-N3)-methyltransferase